MSGVIETHCRMEKRTYRVAHNHQIPGSNPGPATTIAGGASSSRPVGDAAARECGECGPASSSYSAPGHGLITIHITADAAALLALLAAGHGESPGGTVARLVVAEIERKGGIAHV